MKVTLKLNLVVKLDGLRNAKHLKALQVMKIKCIRPTNMYPSIYDNFNAKYFVNFPQFSYVCNCFTHDNFLGPELSLNVKDPVKECNWSATECTTS